jgi:ring-1,2-phenylacetyl-CoA epoxidase subunit PaaE
MTTTTLNRRRATFHPLRVAAIEPITDDSVAITFAVPPELADDYDSRPGSTSPCAGPGTTSGAATRSVPRRVGRAAVAVIADPRRRVLVVRRDRAEVGDTVEVMTPLGRFGTPLDPANAKHYAFVAAGSGITPVLSLVATTLAVEPHSRVTLVYGNRTAASVMFADELADLKDVHADAAPDPHPVARVDRRRVFSGRIDGDRLGRLIDTTCRCGR